MKDKFIVVEEMNSNRKFTRRRTRQNRSPKVHLDSRQWNLPEQPPETSQAVLPFTIQANLTTFNADTTDQGRITYSNVIDALSKIYGLPNGTKLSIRVTHVGAYGGLSTQETTSTASIQSSVLLEDAQTGRQVRGYSSMVSRARAGLHLAYEKAIKWYAGGNMDTIAEKDIAYLRTGESAGCPVNATSIDVVVRGYLRIMRNVGSCN